MAVKPIDKCRAPEGEVERAGLCGRPEQHDARDGGDRQGHQEEAAPPPEGRPPAVGQPADDRIGHGVHDAHGEQRRADRAERQAERLGIEGRHDDVERQRHRRDRDGRKRVEQQAGQAAFAEMRPAGIIGIYEP